MTTCEMKFAVDHDLYKGFLLTDFQIVATSKKRDKVNQVEKEMAKWLHLMKIVIIRGQQLNKDNYDSGPLKELEHWRTMLVVFSHVTDFIESREFKSFFRCLKLSRSKLISVHKYNL